MCIQHDHKRRYISRREAKNVQCAVTIVAAVFLLGIMFGFVAGYGAKAISNKIATTEVSNAQ